MARGPKLRDIAREGVRYRWAVLLAVAGLDDDDTVYATAVAVSWKATNPCASYLWLEAVVDPKTQRPAHRTLAIRTWLDLCDHLLRCEERRDGDALAECDVNGGPCERTS